MAPPGDGLVLPGEGSLGACLVYSRLRQSFLFASRKHLRAGKGVRDLNKLPECLTHLYTHCRPSTLKGIQEMFAETGKWNSAPPLIGEKTEPQI